MEDGVNAAFACRGLQAAPAALTKIILAIAAPGVGFGFWGLMDFRPAGRVGGGHDGRLAPAAAAAESTEGMYSRNSGEKSTPASMYNIF